MKIHLGKNTLGVNHPTYFIADIAANHDGDLQRAKQLIKLAKEAGANAAKFQNFRASKIVSDFGFKNLKLQLSHQAKWKQSVFEVYEKASIPFEWSVELKKECERVGIDYFSAPYDLEAIDFLEEHVIAYKVGSGDIDWIESIEKMANKQKPIFLATGASSIIDVKRAVKSILSLNKNLILMQCNTNYTNSSENFNYINLNVLKTYANLFPSVVLGLSDHTPGYSTVLGAIALGARVIEKHFTDDNNREGPDHNFSLSPAAWKDMVLAARELEKALGSENKQIEKNEVDTVIIQRRCLRAARDIRVGETISREMIDVLRPATSGAILPFDLPLVLGAKAKVDIHYGKELRIEELEMKD